MAGGYGIWADRLELAHAAARTARRVLSEQDGPLSRPLRLSGWDTWRGAVADHFRTLIDRLDRHHVYPFTDERYQANKDLMRYEISRLEARRTKLARRIADGERGLTRVRQGPRDGRGSLYRQARNRITADTDIRALFDRIQDYWESEGYDVEDPEFLDGNRPRMRADADGYALVLRVLREFTTANIDGITPCVKDPAGKPN